MGAACFFVPTMICLASSSAFLHGGLPTRNLRSPRHALSGSTQIQNTEFARVPAYRLHQNVPGRSGQLVLLNLAAAEGQNKTEAHESLNDSLPAQGEQKGTNRIGRIKFVLQSGIVSLYLCSALSLDFYFMAIRPQNFLFVATVLLYSWGLNMYGQRFSSSQQKKEAEGQEDDQNSAVAVTDEKPLPAFCSGSLFNMRGAGRWEGYALFALSVPAAWYFGLSSPRHKLPMVAPHLYLAMMQLLLEALARARRFTPSVRIFIPVAFNTYRLLPLTEWFLSAAFDAPLGCRISGGERLLALLSLLVWAAHLTLSVIPALLFPPPLLIRGDQSKAAA